MWCLTRNFSTLSHGPLHRAVDNWLASKQVRKEATDKKRVPNTEATVYAMQSQKWHPMISATLYSLKVIQ